MQSTVSACTHARRQRPPWPVAQSAPSEVFDVVAADGEVLADGLTHGDAVAFRDEWSADSPARIVASPPARSNRIADPSPREIRQRSEAIRREWSPHEERKRRSWTVQPWSVPHCLDR